MMIAELKNIGKRYILKNGERRSFRESIANLFNGGQMKKEFWALKEINLKVSKGQTVGIIGKNGSGKTTLLKLLSKVIKPTMGSINVNGRVAALLELGAGFHDDLTGMENIYINGL